MIVGDRHQRLDCKHADGVRAETRRMERGCEHAGGASSEVEVNNQPVHRERGMRDWKHASVHCQRRRQTLGMRCQGGQRGNGSVVTMNVIKAWADTYL